MEKYRNRARRETRNAVKKRRWKKNVGGNYDANREYKYAAVEYGCLKAACSFRKRTSCSLSVASCTMVGGTDFGIGERHEILCETEKTSRSRLKFCFPRRMQNTRHEGARDISFLRECLTSKERLSQRCKPFPIEETLEHALPEKRRTNTRLVQVCIYR